MKIKIAIADTDEVYAKRLFEALGRQDNLFLSVFTDKERFEKEIASARYDIILFDYSMYSGDSLFKGARLAVALYDEDNEPAGGIPEKYRTVKKYQRGSSIYREVIGIYSEYVSDSAFLGRSKDSCLVICVYSPVGGAGKTSAALAVANSLANKGRNVMYLNFEPFASYGTYLELKGGKGMGELFAALEGSGSFELKLDSLKKTTPQGIMYFEKFENLLDIYEVTGEDAEKLLRMIGKTAAADYIIADTGSDFNALNRSIMDAADKILLVERPGASAEEKLRSFAEHRTVRREYADKLYSVMNFCGGKGEKSPSGCEVIGHIPEKKASAEEIVSMISRFSYIDIDMLIS
ncbi:MAG: AAA family ATPase [Ruminococcus sp.]|nr:AAA family ATPase [Ruminococcus sp.]